jgi:hypothetical protein
MFIHKKLFKFLLPLAGYLLFTYILLRNMVFVWYDNVPEETINLGRPSQLQMHSMIVTVFATCFVLFLVFGLIFLFRSRDQKAIRYILCAVIFATSYILWLYGITVLPAWNKTALLFVNLVLLLAGTFALLLPPGNIHSSPTGLPQ